MATYYDEEVQIVKDICQNILVKTTPMRLYGRVTLDVGKHDGYNYDHILNTHDGFNIEKEALKVEDDDVVDIDTSKSWCQSLFKDCMRDYLHDRL